MLQKPQKYDSLMLGIVKNNSDPLQMGRLQVYVPALDSLYYETEDLPWTMYVTPFGGTIQDMKIGRDKSTVTNFSSYGMWAIPKVGAHVIIGCLDGNIATRFWIGCVFRPEFNRTLPQALNDPDTKELRSELDDGPPIKDSKPDPQKPDVKIDKYSDNLKEAGLGPDDDNFKTRGWERSVSYPKNRVKESEKKDTDGYAKKPGYEDERDSQIYSWTTPGRHFITMCDAPDNCRIRIKTTEGHQIILDDSNERIYISTAKGRNWIEIDEDGRIMIYAKDEIDIRSEDNINIKSEKDINIKAKQKINLESEEDEINLQAENHIGFKSSSDEINFEANSGFNVLVDDGGIKMTAENDIDMGSNSGRFNMFSDDDFNIRSDSRILITAADAMELGAQIARITVDTSVLFNTPKDIIINNDILKGKVPPGPTAIRADVADTVDDLDLSEMVEPDHESWKRPDSKQQRNQEWKA